MKDETVTITRAEYTQLLEDRDFLNALNEAGAEEWEGYQTALDAIEKEEN
jgi:hypothetical protein|tara:strand:+ start:272 stop:421 length:150 start_codon:yes stop_codon:yes gene_type:complete